MSSDFLIWELSEATTIPVNDNIVQRNKVSRVLESPLDQTRIINLLTNRDIS